MDDREFFHSVADRSGLSRGEAADLTRATLQTLADRISGPEARQLATEVPAGLAEALQAGSESAESYGLDEFVRRVSGHTGLTEPEAETGIRAVLATLRDNSPNGEYAKAMTQLPKEFQP